MAINASVQYNGGLLPDIILLTLFMLPSGNLRLNAKEGRFTSLEPMFPPKRIDNFSPCLGDAQKFFV